MAGQGGSEGLTEQGTRSWMLDGVAPALSLLANGRHDTYSIHLACLGFGAQSPLFFVLGGVPALMARVGERSEGKPRVLTGWITNRRSTNQNVDKGLPQRRCLLVIKMRSRMVEVPTVPQS